MKFKIHSKMRPGLIASIYVKILLDFFKKIFQVDTFYKANIGEGIYPAVQGAFLQLPTNLEGGQAGAVLSNHPYLLSCFDFHLSKMHLLQPSFSLG